MNSMIHKFISFFVIIGVSFLTQASQIVPKSVATPFNHAYSKSDSAITCLSQACPELPLDILRIIASYHGNYQFSLGDGPSGTVHSLALLPHPNSPEKIPSILALGCGDGTIYFLDLNVDPLEPTALSTCTLKEHQAPVSAMRVQQPSPSHPAGLLLTVATVCQRLTSGNIEFDQKSQQASIKTSLNKTKEARGDDRLIAWDIATGAIQRIISRDQRLKAEGSSNCPSCCWDQSIPCALARGFEMALDENNAAESYTRTWNLDQGRHKNDRVTYIEIDPSYSGCSCSSLKKCKFWKEVLCRISCCVAPALLGFACPTTSCAIGAVLSYGAYPCCLKAKELCRPDGRLLELTLHDECIVHGYADGTLIIKDIREVGNPQLQILKKAHSAAITALCPLHSSKMFASASADGVVKIWLAETGKCFETFTRKVKGPVYAVLTYRAESKEGEECLERCLCITGGVGGIEIFLSNSVKFPVSPKRDSAAASTVVDNSGIDSFGSITLAQAPTPLAQLDLELSDNSPLLQSAQPATPITELALAPVSMYQ